MGTRTIKVYRNLMGANDQWAARTRKWLAASNRRMVNLIGSPGCGKTTLLEASLGRLRTKRRIAVLEGDVETIRDAERIRRLGVPVSQLLTGGGCHLEARMVHRALLELPGEPDLIVVENVGNMVCPAEFDLGEHAKIAILSVTEGEDKPVKYPLLFREAGAVVLTKLDLLPHLRFDLKACLAFIRKINPIAQVFQLSAFSGKGLKPWVEWLSGGQ